MFQAVCWEAKDRKLPGSSSQQDRKIELDSEDLSRRNAHKKHRPDIVLQNAIKTVMKAKERMGMVSTKQDKLFYGGQSRHHGALSESDLGDLFEDTISAIQRAGVADSSPLLYTLDLSHLRIRGSLKLLVDAILASPSNRTLNKLVLSHNGIGDEDCHDISHLLDQNSSIENLILDDNEFGQKGLEGLCVTLRDRNTTLHGLNLNRDAIGDVGAISLLSCLEANKSLTSVSLADCGLTNISFRRLGTALGTNKVLLRSLTLSEESNKNFAHMHLGDQLAAVMGGGLSHNQTLTSLSLPNNNISDPGCGDIAVALQYNHTLAHLNLRNNNIGSWGASKFGELLLVNTVLQSLDLSSNDIYAGADVMKLYNGIQANTSLTCLEVHNNTNLKGFLELANEFLVRNRGLLQKKQDNMAMHLKQLEMVVRSKEQMVQNVTDKAALLVHKEKKLAARFYAEQNRTRITPGFDPAISVQNVTAATNESVQMSDDVEGEGLEGVKGHVVRFATSQNLDESIESANSDMVAQLRAGLISAEEMKRNSDLLERLYPKRCVRIFLHVNNPRRRGRGTQVVMPFHFKEEALWEWLLREANRLLPFKAWPGRRIYLDSILVLRTSTGREDKILPGKELGPPDLLLLQDGVELVVSDGRGDGLGVNRRYVPRGGATATERVRAMNHDGHHWSREYWAIFYRFLRARRALLEWDAEKSVMSAQSADSSISAASLPSLMGSPQKKYPMYAWARYRYYQHPWSR